MQQSSQHTVYRQHQPPAPPRRPSRRARGKSPRRSPLVIAAGLLTLGGALALGMVFLAALLLYGPGSSLTAASQPDIAPGVMIGDVPVGGESMASATQMLTTRDFTAQPVTLLDEGRSWTLTLAQLGVAVDIPLTVQLASDAQAGTAMQPWYTVDLNQTQTALVTLSEQVNIDALPDKPGRAMEIPVMLNRLYQNLTGEIADGVLELSMIEVEAPQSEAVVNYTGETSVHVVEPGQELALIARLYGVDMADIIAMNDITNPDLLWVGQELTIPAPGVYAPSAANAPAPPTNSGKAIVVSTQQQRIYAYENGQLVHSYLTSTGLPDTPTVLGDYSIYVKHEKTDMRGPDYYLPDVPYTMYFYKGYGIHGTYWHNSFGRPMSHGCVNLPTSEAQWFFNWAEVGTPVRVV